MGIKRCSSESQISGQYVESSIHKYRSCPNMTNSVVENNVTIPLSISSKASSKVFRTNQKSSKNNTCAENAVLKTDVPEKKNNCINHKAVVFGESCVNENTTGHKEENKIGRKDVQISNNTANKNDYCGVSDEVIIQTTNEYRCRLEVNHEISENISDYISRKSTIIILVDYIQDHYQQLLYDIDTLLGSDVTQKINTYKEWGFLIQRMNKALLRNAKNLELNMIDQFKKEKLRKDAEKKKHEAIKQGYEEDISKLLTICKKAYKTRQWHFDCNFKTFDKRDLLDR